MPKGWITDKTMREAFLNWFGKKEYEMTSKISLKKIKTSSRINWWELEEII